MHGHPTSCEQNSCDYRGLHIEFFSQCSGCATKHHRLGDLSSRSVFSHGSGGHKSETRVPVWPGAGERAPPGSQAARSPLTLSAPALSLLLV